MLHYYFMQVSQRLFIISWASCQIRKIAVAPGMPGTFSLSPRVSDPDMYHGTCVTHVPWCMPGSLTSGFLWNRWWWETFPAFPAHAQPVILRIWQEAHASVITSHLKIFGTRLLYIHGHYLRNAWQECPEIWDDDHRWILLTRLHPDWFWDNDNDFRYKSMFPGKWINLTIPTIGYLANSAACNYADLHTVV